MGGDGWAGSRRLSRDRIDVLSTKVQLPGARNERRPATLSVRAPLAWQPLGPEGAQTAAGWRVRKGRRRALGSVRKVGMLKANFVLR